MRARRATTTTAALLLAFLSVLGTGTYTVRHGDTLSSIAQAQGTTAAALVKANHLSDADHIEVGQTLRMAAASSSGGGSTAGYTVVRGDTLGSIASRHGTSISAVVALNKLRNANLITIGQVLLLPVGSAVSGPSSTPSTKGIEQPAGGATTHVVKAGETVAGIAARYGIPVQQIVDANGITNGRIYAGQRLLLVPESTAGSSGATTYTVRNGDTLSSIAQHFSITLRALQSANGITNPNLVTIGQTLKIPGSTGGVGSIACPVTGTISFMNDWGFPRSGGRFHEGNDLFAPRGRAVVATVSGNATHGVGTLGGNFIRLYGDDGTYYYYAHLDRYGPAGRVTKGQVIGYVGNTGNAAGGPTHTHFEIHPGGGPAVNPYPFISSVCRR